LICIYSIYTHLYFTGKASTSLLLGRIKNRTAFQSVSPALPALGIIPPNTQSTSTETKTQIVPNVDIQLGFTYLAPLYEEYALQLQAGYQALLYINPIQSVDMGSQVITPPVASSTVGVFARTFKRTLSNFGLAGPYGAIGILF